MENSPHIKKELTGYIIRDVFSSLGLSIYILADTYFIGHIFYRLRSRTNWLGRFEY
uniref:hypothetical protein n=1 Tax=Latilactobacillus curvatus TaxID=28038 RepID=UPI0035CF9253